MFKRMFFLLLATLIASCLPVNSTFAATSTTAAIIGKQGVAQGYITVNYKPANGAKVIVRIAKGKTQYDYPLTNGVKYPLQLGNGSYSVLIAEAVNATQYKVIKQETLAVKQTDDKQVFKLSNPLINWTSQTMAVKKAAELTKTAATDQQKVQAIYNFITKKFVYDNNKAKTVKAGYIPNLDTVFKASGGICYDYAATFAAMARSLGIPTKLVMGRERSKPNVEHAWNEVYLSNLKKWVIIDTTYDAARIQGGQKPSLFKNTANYTVTKYF
ncbi:MULTISPECIES: transglutaminase-like domain-containing protein [unclassified Paenibacillus]|uniref:transglutaminase-like domain-containing protein n=1 Tax=unclassified Paenibacillus TaxID=185978 RepID=UPI0010506442|nr:MULTISPECIES: transglutaminase-like domain-containing protein [unclassified Paenibacillus]NIK68200.1 transglutaminase-like putative cysteine protease [Paenibacillus sp. BK720]TCM99583.1 transglutaminase superfamily protein [Paenibacillus sp. BK033]